MRKIYKNTYFLFILIDHKLHRHPSTHFIFRGAHDCVTPLAVHWPTTGSRPRLHDNALSLLYSPNIYISSLLFSQSNPEEEEDRQPVLHGESEFESDDDDLSDRGETAMSHLHVTGPDTDSDRLKRRQEIELQMRDEYLSSPGGGQHHSRGVPSSKSTTPSPPHQQYLYAAGHPFAAAAAAFLSPSQLAAAQAAAVASMAAAHQQHAAAQLGGGGGSSGSATPPDHSGGMAPSPGGGRGMDQDQSKYTYEEQFKQVRTKVKFFQKGFRLGPFGI